MYAVVHGIPSCILQRGHFDFVKLSVKVFPAGRPAIPARIRHDSAMCRKKSGGCVANPAAGVV